jgi:hypothetical protein
MRRLLPILLVPLALTAACASPNAAQPIATNSTATQPIDTPSTATPSGHYRPGDVVLRVGDLGGLVTPSTLLSRLPDFSLYGDGRVITEGPQIAIYPGPALPSVTVRTVSAAGIARLVQLALDAGVGNGADTGRPLVADVPSTIFTVMVGGMVRTTNVDALGFDTGLTPAQLATRQKLTDLIDKLGDLPATLGAADAGSEQPYAPQTMAVISSPWDGPPTGQPAQPQLRWPGPALPGPEFDRTMLQFLHCISFTGAELTAVLAAASHANAETPWVWQGAAYSISFRPLLPDESSCDDLKN